MKVLLTSAGFENANISKVFLNLITTNPSEAKVVFVTTAANSPEAISVLPKCVNDLLSIGIKSDNIVVYDLHYRMPYKELKSFDAIYFCGGDPDYLNSRIIKTGFRKELLKYIKSNGVYVGVSAGSCIAAANVKKGLGLINCKLNVHCDKGNKAGKLPDNEIATISLTNTQAIWIHDNGKEIIE